MATWWPVAACWVVYKITYNNCNKKYIGETGRKLCVRSKEHKQVDDLPDMTQPKAQQKRSTSVRHKPAICDHVHQQNYVIDWGGGITTLDSEETE